MSGFAIMTSSFSDMLLGIEVEVEPCCSLALHVTSVNTVCVAESVPVHIMLEKPGIGRLASLLPSVERINLELGRRALS